MTLTLMNIIDDIPNFSISGYWSKLVFLDYDINDYILKNLFKTFFFLLKIQELLLFLNVQGDGSLWVYLPQT
jgi:hypothetical protein